MKMFKKLMAVVLTGALAVSMLTGCEAAKNSALKSALNSGSTQTSTGKVINYKHESNLDNKAEDILKNVFKNDKANLVETATAGGKIAANDSTATNYSKQDIYTKNGKTYAFYVAKAPKNSDASKSGEWSVSKVHDFFVSGARLNKTVTGGTDYTTNSVSIDSTSDKYVLKGSKATKEKIDVDFGVKYYKNGDNNFAIIVVELVNVNTL